MVKGNFKYETFNKRELSIDIPDDSMNQMLVQSVISNGLLRPILIADVKKGDKITENMVVDGMKILEIANKIGIETFRVAWMGTMTEEEFTLKYLQINTYRLNLDYIAISKIIAKISDTYGANSLTKVLPYDIDQIKSLVKLTTFDWDSFKKLDGVDESQTTMF